MGILKNGILGGVSGKVGGVVGFNIFGKDVIRGYSKPANPKTVAQTNQRSKFSATLVFAQALLSSIINVYWKGYKSGMSAYNAFMGANINLADTSGILTDAQQILRGSLETSTLDEYTYETGTGVVLANWVTDCISNGLPTDQAIVVCWDNENKVGWIDDSTYIRSDGMAELTVGSGRTSTDLMLYVAFSRGTSPDFLNSNTIGHVVEDA